MGGFFGWLPLSWLFATGLLILWLAFVARVIFWRAGTHALVLLGVPALGLVLVLVGLPTMMVQVPLTLAAREYTGIQDAYVKCDSEMMFFFNGSDSSNVKGLVNLMPSAGGAHMAHLGTEACAGLSQLLAADGHLVTDDTAFGLGVLAHETGHVFGDLVEASTECRAIQDLDRFALLLGASPEEARQLTEVHMLGLHSHLPEQYYSPDCVEDGAWDLTPGDGVWP